MRRYYKSRNIYLIKKAVIIRFKKILKNRAKTKIRGKRIRNLPEEIK